MSATYSLTEGGQMSTPEDLLALERESWVALSSSPPQGVRFFARVLAPHPLMLLPHGLRLDGRDSILATMGGPPWRRHRLEDLRVLDAGPDTGVVTYGVTAERDDQPPYSAFVSSTYVRRNGAWNLILHQQTPRP